MKMFSVFENPKNSEGSFKQVHRGTMEDFRVLH
jgi:hypothetical protein